MSKYYSERPTTNSSPSTRPNDLTSFLPEKKGIGASLEELNALDAYYPPARDWNESRCISVVTHFPDITVRTQHPTDQDQNTRAVLIEREGRVFDLCTLIPEPYVLRVGNTLTGRINHQEQRISIPFIEGKGVIISAAHEIGHARRFLQFNPSERRRYQSAFDHFIEKRATTDEKKIILEDERAAWEFARETIPLIHKSIGYMCYPNRNAIEEYIRKRLATYER